MNEKRDQIQKDYKEGSFHRLFWDQQIAALSAQPTQRRWHPMLIRWCFHLKMISSSVYDALKGVLTLDEPSRTIYSHYTE